MHGYFRSTPDVWPMPEDKAPETLCDAEYIVVFAEAAVELRGDTANTYRWKSCEGEVDLKALCSLPLKVHFLSYATFVSKWEEKRPILLNAVQNVRSNVVMECAVRGTVAIRESPTFRSAVVRTVQGTTLTIGDCACRSAKNSKKEVYLRVHQPTEGWVLHNDVLRVPMPLKPAKVRAKRRG